ncbi:MAG: site-specific DNA-methyltransferase [Thermodesulfobacteriota bacterium]
MAKKSTKKETVKEVTTITHARASRKNIPTAEYQSVMRDEEKNPVLLAYQRRNRDLDPQLVWRGKDMQDWSDLIVQAPPLYIQEKVHPKILIDDLRRQTEAEEQAGKPQQLDLFADFNGLPDEKAKTEFYKHDANWSNRMILGDSLQVMASLAEREGLRGKVQCIYIDPPYGIKFNSNFQWSTTSRDVKDGKAEHITREPEQVKAFRDTWRDGIHSYLTYLRDRLTVARDLLTDSGSIFVQIGDENVHRVRALMDEVFGEDNFCCQIVYQTTSTQGSNLMPIVNDNILWFGKNIRMTKYRQLFNRKIFGEFGTTGYGQIQTADGRTAPIASISDLGKEIKAGGKIFASSDLTSSHYSKSENIYHCGKEFNPKKRYWSTSTDGMYNLQKADRLMVVGDTLRYKRFLEDFDVLPITNLWSEQLSEQNKSYVVQTASTVIQRCILLSTDPGDLVLDPTCGSGTTAYVAEQWGRRWITIDTSRVALALARARLMGARYSYYLLADSPEGRRKEAEITQIEPSRTPTYNDIRQGFVYQRVPHITLKSIANNTEIDVIWEKYQAVLEPLREKLNKAVKEKWEEWEIPREADDNWPKAAQKLHADWWESRIARQKEIDASIAAKADYEYLYDKPYEDGKKVRVAGPFTVESLSPHRVLGVDENDELIDGVSEPGDGFSETYDFTTVILENLKIAGVQQAHKEDKITFTSLAPWPGHYVCAEGRYAEGDTEKRAAILIGPEFGTVSKPDLVAAAREAGDGGFDTLIACAFNYDAHSSEFDKLGRIPILKARMNADLHMADELKNTGKGNLFVIFGEPDIEILPAEDDQIQVQVKGVDVFHPSTGEIRSNNTDEIACWFIDTDYNEESFFVRHAYFLGANDPYKSLKTTLKAEINQEAWESLNSDTSRPFPKPASGRIAVKVINHLGDEVMKVFKV